MKRVYLSGAIEAKPDLTQLTSEGYPTDGNAQTSLPPTVPGAAWAHMIMEELMAIIEAGGVTPERDTLTQVRDAIPKYIPEKLADGAINGSKLTQGSLTFALLASAMLANASDVTAATAIADKLLTPAVAKTLVNNILAVELAKFAALSGATFTGPVKGPSPTEADDFVTLSYLLGAVQSVPPGTIIAYLGTDVPEGYLLCNGGTIQRSQYPNLVGPLGSVPACAGDGSTTLVLPNLNDRFIEFSTTLSKIGTTIEAGLPNITGTIEMHNVSGAGLIYPDAGETGALFKTGSARVLPNGVVASGAHLGFDSSRCSSLFGNSETVQSPSLYVLPVIKS